MVATGWKRGGAMRFLMLGTMVAITGTLLVTPPATAADRFEGTCTLTGQLRFAKPLGNEPRDTTFQDRASGTCDGTLNGAEKNKAPVEIRASGSGSLGCLAGHSTSAGTLTFSAEGAKIRFFTDTTGGLTQFASRFRGAVSGEGVAEVNFLAYADESTTAACQAGTLASARYDLTARTTSPLVG
jgi:hypothetical protein